MLAPRLMGGLLLCGPLPKGPCRSEQWEIVARMSLDGRDAWGRTTRLSEDHVDLSSKFAGSIILSKFPAYQYSKIRVLPSIPMTRAHLDILRMLDNVVLTLHFSCGAWYGVEVHLHGEPALFEATRQLAFGEEYQTPMPCEGKVYDKILESP